MTQEKTNGGYGQEQSAGEKNGSKGLAAKLVICIGKKELQAVPVENDIILGRETGEGCLGIPSGKVRTDHGKLVRVHNGFAYEDLEGKGCTYLNGVLVSPENFPGMKQIPLSDGDVLRFENECRETENEECAVILYRKRYVENAQWRALELDQKSSRYYISRHEEKTGPEASGNVFLSQWNLLRIPVCFSWMSRIPDWTEPWRGVLWRICAALRMRTRSLW